MKLYVQFMIILIFSLVGEIISTVFNLPIPGSIIGLILLFVALEVKLVRLRHIYTVGKFMLDNMTILFLPAGVGIMQYFKVIIPNLLPILIITLGALVINLLTIGLIVTWIKNRFEGDYKD
ncbi:CidA/LrgA family protein [Streptococcus tangpeifui]|uniref:LrgA family protein n=1 Tax=Streptococcus criceti HS-6 TaxID=873449 RepID=G5JRK1_STRCG|nr:MULTISPECIES: CidA/LrgA family protein [Streptococcus]EHI74131.1 LrgA family protein [Streptococcus criceti HS-6]SUN42907.1 effector of murein hydrolase LrgA [Streptococcus criceti]